MIIDKSAYKWIIDNMYDKSYLNRYGQYPIGIRFHLGIIDNHNEMKMALEIKLLSEEVKEKFRERLMKMGDFDAL